MADQKATNQKVVVLQVRSGNRSRKDTIATLEALGLGKIGRVKEHTLTSSTRGMIQKVSHLVEVRAA